MEVILSDESSLAESLTHLFWGDSTYSSYIHTYEYVLFNIWEFDIMYPNHPCFLLLPCLLPHSPKNPTTCDVLTVTVAWTPNSQSLKEK